MTSTIETEDVVALDRTPTGAFGLPRWKYMLRLHAACLEVTDKPLTPEYRTGLADMLGKLEHQIEALDSATPIERLREENARRSQAGFFEAAEEVMHFINALDSDGMDANAVRSAIYHKCLEMRPRAALNQQ